MDRLDDDSSAEAVALLAVLGRIWQMADGLLYNDLSRAHFAQSATVSLPLAGEVNLWVFQSRPFPRGEDEITALEESVRTAEELMGVPFPSHRCCPFGAVGGPWIWTGSLLWRIHYDAKGGE